MDKCQDQPPALLVQGIAEFNNELYFECHETLERLWLRESAAVRELYQGILQIGVAFFKQKQGNYRGAVNLLRRGLTHLAPFSPACQGVDVDQLIADATRALSRLTDLGPGRTGELEAHFVPRVWWVK
jgi:predicted metal-dependent hydrolase